eukprot:gnl/TRDRNA2_/TRDRNA2_172245_c1_seq2.p1 gnl/TRDRNA2_/TRDRNA2_172245_c1~~gnl/TRDRNA2_/TRDRNA2_172245_c1_seq2.p1  ORF type:complete len:215 (+),score=45.26 gnl/TRDRNA2_/TRDRNA2_172245_c1_seq2:68-712(+)
MTTNAKSRLDPALVRSGRIDYEIEFKAADQEQIQRLFMRFYSDFSSEAKTPASSVKPAAGTAAVTVASDTHKVHKCTAEDEFNNAVEHPELSELAETFASRVGMAGLQFTTADIQRHLMKHKKSPMRALNDLASIFQTGGSASVDVERPLVDRKVSHLGNGTHARDLASNGLEKEVHKAEEGTSTSGMLPDRNGADLEAAKSSPASPQSDHFGG